ncbi:hypothetical protein SAMN04487820_104111 [Actinopolyspora mzabensis]|uniref:Pyridoxal phosphate homeostasis protein n=1 Tax=Actinopolyspora mzabensis TaxID=995066 RepID=A0A1G8YX57_ACTMZ|nr:YggS family pyridoxal phosphate-dependent enzyme [Actinopolyspora mzabensis]SDK07356.1 hypothetical protein SAMN04487820_104111 [Actinopolyspora mzabensis]
MNDETTAPARKAEIADSLARVGERIERACGNAGRSAGEVGLSAVTKTFPASDAALLADLGVTDLAENRDQEAAPKVREFRRLRPRAPVRWHMVGQLQRNKARSVVRWADVVESVDSRRLVEALQRAVGGALESGERSEPLDALLQVDLEQRADRGGCSPEEVPELAEMITRMCEIRLCGVMAVAPLNEDPDVAFATLSEISERLRRDYSEAREVSAGMSGDLESAIAHGSTRVRVGTALLGGRPLVSP